VTRRSALLIALASIAAVVVARIATPDKALGTAITSAPVRRDTMVLAVPAGALSFFALGDFGQRGNVPQRRVARQMATTAAALRPAFILALGDNFYPTGVRNTSDRQFFSSWENVYTAPSLQVDWYVALGNHDYLGKPDAEVLYSAKNPHWKMPARYYSMKQQVAPGVDAEFIILDTSPFIVEYREEPPDLAVTGTDTVAQRMWLDSTLDASTAKWKFIIGHHHVFSGGPRGTQPELQELLEARMQHFGVTAYIGGHEHHLEHIVPSGANVNYFISGAGSENRGASGREGTRFASSSLGFLAMSLTADSVLVQMVDDRGQLLYRTALKK
jgi:acid phosphatase